MVKKSAYIIVLAGVLQLGYQIASAQSVPDINVVPASHNYGTVCDGSFVDKTFVVSNTGTANLIVTAVDFAPQEFIPYTVVSGGPPFTLSPGKTQNLVVRCAPSGAGVENAILLLFSNDQNENPFNVALQSTRSSPATLGTPTNLVATAVSTSQINLSWNDNSQCETRYRLERKIGAGAFSLLTNSATNSTSMVNANLIFGTTYTYRVRAENSVGVSAFSNTSSATTFNPVPTLTSISPITGNRLQTLNVIFTGTNFIDGVTSVNVGSGITVNSTTVNSSTSLTANLTIAANAAIGERVFLVINSAPGGGQASTIFTVNESPAPPSNLVATPSSHSQINLMWQDNATDEDGFIIERETGASGNYSPIATVGTNVTNYNDTGLAGNTNFSYRVLAFNSKGNSAYSNDANAITLPNPPAAPQNLAASATSSSQILLSWNATGVTGEDGFMIFRSTSPGVVIISSNLVGSVGTNIENFTDTGLSASTTYFYKIVAFNVSGNSSPTNEAVATTFNSAPTLAGLAPNNGKRLQTLDVVFTGSNFIDGLTSVNAGSDITVNSTTVNSATSLTVNLTIAAGAATGARNFSVTNSGPGGGTSANRTFTVNNPGPTLASIAPNNGKRLQTVDVVFTGTNFIDGVTSVNVGSGITVNSTTVNSATSLTVNLTIAAGAATGARNFFVTNGGPGGGTSVNRIFTVNNPAPTLASLAPNNGKRLQTLDVVFTGSNFIDGVTSVNVGSDITVNSATVNNATSLTVNLTIAAGAATGARNFFVTNSGPGGGNSANQTFTVNNPAPTLASIAPTNGNRLQTLDVVFTGTNFIAGVSSVNFGADITVNSTTVNSATQITANITIGSEAAFGARNVSVTNSGGTSANQTFTVGNNPAPTLTSISPISGSRLQTLDVVFTGTNFINGVTSVNVGSGITVNSTTVNSATSLTANLTITAAAATGARNFSVTNSGPGGGNSANQTFTVSNPAPTLASLSPTNGNRLQTLDVVFTGTNFINGATSVNVGSGIAVNSTTINSATSLTANLTITAVAATGARNFSVTNSGPGGGNSANQTFTVNNPAPTLTSLSPTNGNRLQTLDVVFTGTNFIAGVSSVNFGADITVNSTTVNSTTQLTANITIDATAALGARNVSVANSGPGGGTSANKTFTVGNNPAPTLTSISPNIGNRLQTLDVIFTGTNFINGVTSVNVGSGIMVNSTTVNSSTSLTANLTIAATAATGARNFSVTNSAPGGGNSANQTFTVNNPAPTLASIAPTNGNRLQTLDVVFTGTNFIAGVSSVNFGADITVNSTTVNSATQITANITIGSEAAFGARNVSVTNSGPGGGNSANQTFTVNNPGPTLASIAPANGNRLQTLDVVFTGTNFISGVSSVNFGADITVNSTTVNSTTQLTTNITIGANAAFGARNVSITNSGPGGGSSANQTFTVGSNPAPTLTSISPISGSRLQTLDVVFTGTNFINGVTSVNVGSGITVNSTTVNSATSLTANLTITAAAATGARNFFVTNSGPGGGNSANQTFTVNNPGPTLASIAPTNGNRLQTLDVILTGTNFINGVTSVNVGSGITVNSTTVNSATSLTANLTISATAATGARNFSVTNSGPGGGNSANQTFTVSNPAPTLASLSPTNGNRLQTLDVVFTGTNFIDGVTSVNVGSGMTVNSTTINSATQLTANITIDATAAFGARNVSVTNSGPGGGTSANQTFTIGNNPAPTLTSIAPISGNRLQTLDVVFTGTNFISGVTSVNVGSDITVNSTTVNSATSLTANLTITAAAATGARNFSVTNSGPGGGTSANRTFTVNNPAPTLASIAPTNGNRLQTLDVVFTGTNFTSGASSVNFGADITVNSTTVNPANGGTTQLTANITIDATAALGARNVSVANSGPGGGTSTNKTFTVGNNPAPTLTSISPNIGNRLQTLDVIFTGTNFISGVTSVNVGSDITVNSTTVNSATNLTANLTITAAAATGARNFSITNSGPGGGNSANQVFTVNNPAPTLASIAPTNGNRLQTLDVVFTGTNFIDGVTSVNAGSGIIVTSTTVNSATSLTANLTITAGAATGARDFSVTNSGPGGGTSANQTFTVKNPAPTLASIAPANGNRLQTLDVVFTGTNFINGVTSVNAGSGIIVTSTTVNSATSLTANLTIAAGAATGARNFFVTNSGPGGGNSANQTFTVNNPGPTLASIAPTNGNRLQTLDIVFIGTNFIAGVSSVNFGADITVNSTTVNSATQITANITIGANAAFGARNVSVTNSSPGGGTSANQTFTVGNNPSPTLTSISPNIGNRLQTLDVVFMGTNFINGASSVNVGSGITVNSTTVNSATSLTANLTITAAATTGARDFSVTNSGPGGGTSANQTFTVNNPAPTLTSLSPTNGNRLQTLDVVFTGTNFIAGVSSVNFGADITVNSTTVNSTTQLTANITIDATAALGARNVSVANSGPGGGTSANKTFTVGNNPAPTLTSISPNIGNRLQTLDVIFTGTNFINGVTSVNVGSGITVNSTTVNSATSLTANLTITAAAATGARNFSVTNSGPGGGNSANQTFTVNNPAPTLASIAPTNGNRLQTLDVVFTGTNFISGVSSVSFGANITVNSTIVNSTTQLTTNITIGGSAALGVRNVSVANSGPGGGSSANQTFTVGNNPAPTLTSISPNIGNRLQTLDVILTGTNFINGVTSVNVGSGITVNSTTVNSATSLTANLTIAATAATGARNFFVTNSGPGGGNSANQTFTVSNPAPTLASLSPTNGNRLQTLDVVFTGSNFIDGVTSVNVGSGITVNSTTVNSATSLTVNLTIAAGAATGARNFSVTNSGPGGGTSANRTFTVNNPAPTLASIAPTNGNRLQTLDVVFTGTNFIDGITSVNVGSGMTVNSTTVNSGTQLTANITIDATAALGARNVSVSNSGPGGGTSANQTFTVGNNPAPTLASLSPTNGNRLQTLDVVFTGTNFIDGVTSVNAGSGIIVTSTTVNSATSLTANLTITAGAATGARDFSVTNSGPGGGTSANQTFTVNNPAPTLVSLSPTNGNRLQTLDVIFTGMNFISGVSSVNFGADITVNSTTVNSTTQLTANITIGANAAFGARNVSIVNSGPGGGTSANQTFTVGNNPAPTLTSISPISGSRLQTLDVVFTGTNFISGVTSVNVGSDITVNSTTINSATSLTANLTITAGAATGARNFSVTNSGPGGGNSANQTFTVNNPAPTLASLSPANGNRLQTLDVVFTGTNFIANVSSVNFGADITLNSTTVNSTTQITANITIGGSAVFGARNVAVVNSGPGGGTSANQTFTVGNNPAPTLTSISPNIGNRLQTLDVIFTGTNFIDGVTSVNVGSDITVNSTTVNSATSLTANLTITAAAATGARNFSITNSGPGGGTSANQTFTVNNPAPTLASIAPTNGNRLQTLDVTFTGTNFISGVSSVNFGADITVNSTTVNPANGGTTQLTANITIGANAAFGARNVSVTNSGPGGGTSANQTFTIGNNPAPTLTSIAPISGNRLQTLDVVFTGTNFINGVTSVNVGSDITVNSTTVNSATNLTANLTITAAAATGARNFSITNSGPGGGNSANQVFTVNNPAPTLASIAPTNGNRLQTLDLVFTGTNFISGVSSVNFGADITVNSTTVNSATQITANITIDATAAFGARNVSVTNSGPGGGTSANQAFTIGNNPAPTLTSISPNIGNRLQTMDVIFIGTNFINGVASVNVGSGITVNSTIVNDLTSLRVNLTITAAAATGARNFSVTNSGPGGGNSANQTFTVNNPGPTLASIAPTNGNRLQTLDVILTGTNFISGVSSVNFGADITVNSTTVNPVNGGTRQITANITIGTEAAFGARNVSVVNSGPGGGTSINQVFTVGNNPAPTLTSISPINGNRLQTLDVVFTGTNFINGVTSVNVGSGMTINSTTINSSTSLTANLTITAAAATGARIFSIVNSGPGGGISANRTFTVNNPAPALTGISPASGNRLQTLDVIFTGTNFISGVSSVSFGAGITVNSIVVDSATQITAKITMTSNAALGARNVSVINKPPGGATAILPNGFTIAGNPGPTLTGIAPIIGNRLQTLDVVFTGTNFISGVTSVNVGSGITVNSKTVNSATSLTANLTITAAAAIGPRNFSIINSGPGGGISANQTFAVENPAPTVTSISPDNGERLQTLDVVFTGTNFISGVTAVNVGGGITVHSTKVNNSASLTANLTITAGATIDARNFFVTNSGPGGGASDNQTFTVNNPVPTLTSLSPPNARRLQTLNVILAGTNFINGVSSVDFGPDITVNSTTVTSPVKITANITIGANAALGARDVAISNIGPNGGTATLESGFTVGSNPSPTLTSLSPPAGNRLQTLEVIFTGTNFISGVSSVNLGDDITVHSTTVKSARQITANITIRAEAAFGAREVSVINAPPGGGTATLPDGFTVGSNPTPTLTSLAPTTGRRLQTLNVIFTGANFISGVTSVNVGPGMTVNSTKVNNSTSLTASLIITASAATGAQNFSVTNSEPGGGTSGEQIFTVNNPVPTLTSLSPPNARRLQRLDVILTGTNFIDGVSSVNFGDGVTVNSATVNPANGGTTKITANVTISADAALGAREVAITNALPGGGTAILPNGFTVGSNPAPTLTSIAPVTGKRLQTLDVVFTGTNFIDGVTAVNAGNGITINSTTVNSSTSLSANLTITAVAATGPSSFAVINTGPGGGTSANRTFTVNNPGPTLASVAPTNANRLQTLDVVLAGTNFISGVSSVNFGAAITVNSITINPANGGTTQLTANITISSNATFGPRNVSVTNAPPGGGTATLPNVFRIGSNPAPTLTGLSPANGNRLQTFDVVLTGTNFISGVSSVNFGAGVTVNSITINPANGGTTEITANITIGSNAALGARNVAVVNAPPGGGTATLTNGFTVGGNPAPILTGILPASGNRMQTLDIVFTGTNFISGITAVNVGSGVTINSTTMSSSTSLAANLTIAAEAATGARNFSVTNSGPGGGISANQIFTVNNPAPTLMSISPASGNRLQTLDVIFTGTNFLGGITVVNAGSGIVINSTTVNNSTSLTANLTIAADAAAGARNFSVTNSGPGGGVSANHTFTVNELPPPPSPPSSLVAEAMSMSQINLHWADHSTNETGFKIVRRVGTEVRIFTVGPNVQNYQDGEMNRGTTASYQVYAYNAGGDSPLSNFAEETTATGVRCDVTRDFKVDANDVDFEIKIILQNPTRRITRLDSTTADTNLDGKINVIDVVDCVNESLKSLLAATASPRESSDAPVGTELRLGSVDMIVGATAQLPVTLASAEPVTALQLKIRGDSRMLALGDPVLAPGNHGMTLVTARAPDQLAVLIYSLSGDYIHAGTRELLQFSLHAKSADFSKAGLQIESALLIGKAGTRIPVRIANDAANVKINLPDKFALSQNYPNPFDTGAANSKTEIVYTIPAAGAVKLAIYDVLGHEVAILTNSWQTPGVKKALWNGRDRKGKRVPAGIYFYRLEAGDFVARQKMVLQ